MAITKPYTFVAGTKAKAVEVNEDFDVLYREASRLDVEISNIKVDVQDVETSKADINGNATQIFKLANPVDSYDGVNKNYLENAIANIKNYIFGYMITKDTDNSIIVLSGSCYDSTFSTVITSTGNITKEYSNQTPNQTYYVYVISDNSGRNVDILIAEEAVTPPRPEGYSLFRQIGSYTTDENSKIYLIYNLSNSITSDYIQAGLIPNYSAGISVSNGYVAPKFGYCYVQLGNNSFAYVDEQTVAWHSGAVNYHQACGSTFPVPKGSTITGSNVTSFTFYPAIGGN